MEQMKSYGCVVSYEVPTMRIVSVCREGILAESSLVGVVGEYNGASGSWGNGAGLDALNGGNGAFGGAWDGGLDALNGGDGTLLK